jgi:hypothetical protein
LKIWDNSKEKPGQEAKFEKNGNFQEKNPGRRTNFQKNSVTAQKNRDNPGKKRADGQPTYDQLMAYLSNFEYANQLTNPHQDPLDTFLITQNLNPLANYQSLCCG